MPQRRSHIGRSALDSELTASLAALRESLDIPDEFPAEVEEEAASVQAPEAKTDLRDVPFATLDPLGSRDLDQAFHLKRDGRGFLVRYAIADVPSFVRMGGAIDREARSRGQTFYAPDGTIPLHPRSLSENRASLLPDEDRTAFVWTFRLDDEGSLTDSELVRALVRSRAQLDYASTQKEIDDGIDNAATLLPEVGALRIEQERLRSGASLNMPDEEIERDEHGRYRIERRRSLPIENWNAQLSLLTGMVAADIMLTGRVGILRTMPAPEESAITAFRAETVALGRPWKAGSYGDYLRSLDGGSAEELVILHAASALFRGAGYVAFDGDVPEATVQAALASPYAHVTAPLRRLVDRWGLIVCEALMQGRAVPDEVRESLPELPGLMQSSSQRSGALSRGALDRVEAALLTPHIGESFSAIVVENRKENARISIAEPPITASVKGLEAEAGSTVSLTLQSADIGSGTIEFTAGSSPQATA